MEYWMSGYKKCLPRDLMSFWYCLRVIVIGPYLFYPNISLLKRSAHKWLLNHLFRYMLDSVTNNCFNLLADRRDTQTVSLQVDTANFLDSYRRDGTWNPWSESESGRLYFMLFVQIIARSLVSLFNANIAPFKFKQFQQYDNFDINIFSEAFRYIENIYRVRNDSVTKISIP